MTFQSKGHKKRTKRSDTDLSATVKSLKITLLLCLCAIFYENLDKANVKQLNFLGDVVQLILQTVDITRGEKKKELPNINSK